MLTMLLEVGIIHVICTRVCVCVYVCMYVCMYEGRNMLTMLLEVGIIHVTCAHVYVGKHISMCLGMSRDLHTHNGACFRELKIDQ